MVASTTALLFLILLALDSLGYLTNPYLGLILFIALPLAFLIGLLIIPVGMWIERRRRRTGGPAAAWPTVDLNNPDTRRAAALVLLATILNVTILTMATYGAVHYMETPSFCGQVCHQVMHPEFVAYQDGPHARVACVECHVGSGAQSLVRSKISGMRQLMDVITASYPKPVSTPVRTLRPARDTCEQCHWSEKFHGDKIRLVREYSDDEGSSESMTTLIVHVGGGSEKRGLATGIHWHMNLANEIDYIATDSKRQVIPYVRLKDRNGVVREYLAEGTTQRQLQGGERRRMDCMDCHSRPSHTFVATPQRAVDQAIATGLVDRAFPYIRRESVVALSGKYGSQEEAASSIDRHLRTFYRSQASAAVPPATDLNRSIAAVQDIYSHNVFPAMNVGWGTYENELGHVDSPGCFRCHDDNHKSSDGRLIRQDCDICHEVKME